jgi:rubrerythrin
MKTFLLAAVAALFAIPTPFPVQKAPTNAVNNERAAVARYEAFAAKAEDEGYLGAASLFRACAKAERVHLQRFVGLMTARDFAPPSEAAPKIAVGSTRENLQTAILLEQGERDSVYLYAINVCNEAKDEVASHVFDITRDAEVEHANLEAAAMRNLESMRHPREYYVLRTLRLYHRDQAATLPSCRDARAPSPVQ